MRRALYCVITCAAFLATASTQAFGAITTFKINDIGQFEGYTTPDVGQSYYGDGFVGMYADSFAHLFGAERNDYSKTAMNVNIADLAGATINSAVLAFDFLHGKSGTQQITLTSFTANGNLSHMWMPSDSLGTATYTVNGLSANELDVTSFVQERLASNAEWLGLHLQGSNRFQWTYTDARGGGPDAATVRLVVDYQPVSAPTAVPEPFSFAVWSGLGMFGAAVGIARRRRQKNSV